MPSYAFLLLLRVCSCCCLHAAKTGEEPVNFQIYIGNGKAREKHKFSNVLLNHIF